MTQHKGPPQAILSTDLRFKNECDTLNIEPAISFENQIEDDQIHSPSPPQRSSELLVPALLVCLPMLVLCAALLSVVFGYQIRPQSSIFDLQTLQPESKVDYLLVNYSDTKIVFVASFLSTIAPTLAGCVMTIASVALLRSLHGAAFFKQSCSGSDPRQQYLLQDLINAKYRRLFVSLKYLLWKRGTHKNNAVAYATALLLLTIMMCIAVTVSDAALHILTKTVSFTLYSTPSKPTAEYGRGINAFCSSLDRVKSNYGFPCTAIYNSDLVEPNFAGLQAESQKLGRNTSSISEIRYAYIHDNETQVAYLIPKPQTINPDVDFQAGTLGASAKCSLIPASTCNLTRWGPYDKIYTNFNCSSSFWGTLGLAENVSALNSFRQPSPYLPLLALKPQSNLQFSFYSDSNLENLYNPAGLNDSIFPDPNLRPTPDNELPSTIHMAFAWRASWNSFNSSMKHQMIAANQTGVYSGIYYLDYFLDCEITAYTIDYVWLNNTVQSVTSTPISNGTIVNMWQATTPYRPSINGGGLMLQDTNIQAAAAGTTITSYEQKFSQLLSQQVLAPIGAFSSPRMASKQQDRYQLLLAKIPKAALGSLLASSLLYPVLGLLLLLKAHRSLRRAKMDDMLIDAKVDRLTTMPDSWQERHKRSYLEPNSYVHKPEQSHVAVLPHTPGNRNSTAGFRFVLFGNAGIGPNFNHLST